jgi:hypothetical protein
MPSAPLPAQSFLDLGRFPFYTSNFNSTNGGFANGTGTGGVDATSIGLATSAGCNAKVSGVFSGGNGGNSTTGTCGMDDSVSLLKPVIGSTNGGTLNLVTVIAGFN